MEFFTEGRNWVSIAIVLFFVIFGRKLWAAIAGMLDGHAEAVRAELAEAARLRREAEAMLADATTRREQAIVEAKRMLEGARDEAARVTAEAAAEAARSAERRERMAHDRIAAAEKAAVTEVRLAAAEVAGVASEQIIRTTLTGTEADALVDHAIAQLPAALRAA
jgi:F-type H+-transporting ATPase subunit b